MRPHLRGKLRPCLVRQHVTDVLAGANGDRSGLAILDGGERFIGSRRDGRSELAAADDEGKHRVVPDRLVGRLGRSHPVRPVPSALGQRPEGIEAGSAFLVGTRKETIVSHLIDLLENQYKVEAMAKASNVYGDGQAAKRIVGILEKKLGES
ncbi:MAG: UDP-N-acetyl glucosamine 2-epimerase [Desulfobulbaceae bacterium]|nr:UDP-N-acetyl glucosamine 2-epimerase [Desulfobulbaceae bacterium]